MDQRSVFFEEWLRSLREQYKHVVRSDDKVTLPTLTAVMQNVGFGEDELKQLRIEATMHIDDVPDGFVPDPSLLQAPALAPAHHAECVCPQCSGVDLAAHDADGQPITPEPEHESDRVIPVADLGRLELADEKEPVTFEDGLAEENALAENGDADSDTEEAPDDDAEAPGQMSLF